MHFLLFFVDLRFMWKQDFIEKKNLSTHPNNIKIIVL